MNAAKIKSVLADISAESDPTLKSAIGAIENSPLF